MICPDRCTIELWGTYQGIKVQQVYRCKHCTVTSYRSVEMDSEKLIAELREQLAAKDAELERVRSDRGKLASAATLVVSNWDIFEMQDTTARQVFGSSIGWLRDALASPAGEAVENGGLKLSQSQLKRLLEATNGVTIIQFRAMLKGMMGQTQPAPATEPYKPGQLTLNSLKGLVARIEMDADPFTDLGVQCRASLPALKEMIARLESRPRPIPLDEVLAEFASDPETKAAMEQAKEELKAAIARGEKVFEAKDIVFVAVQEKK